MKRAMLMLLVIIAPAWLHAQTIPACKADDLVKRIANGKDTVFVINFWATWCVPCVQELPQFNALYQDLAGKPVKMLLVSLDFKEDYPMRLATFIERKHLKPDVTWLNETNPNDFLPKIEPKWEGSIPATLVVSTGRSYRKFIESTITEDQVMKCVNDALAK